MNATPVLPDTRPLAVLEDLINQHGRLSVFVLALAALLRPGRKPMTLAESDLSDHVLRDIGLQPRDASAKSWERYR